MKLCSCNVTCSPSHCLTEFYSTHAYFLFLWSGAVTFFVCLCGSMLNLVLLHHQIVNTDFRAVYLFASSFSFEIHSICSTLFTNLQIKLQIHVVDIGKVPSIFLNSTILASSWCLLWWNIYLYLLWESCWTTWALLEQWMLSIRVVGQFVLFIKMFLYNRKKFGQPVVWLC